MHLERKNPAEMSGFFMKKQLQENSNQYQKSMLL